MELDTIHCGDALKVLRGLPANSIHCCVTSPPYYGLRDYGEAGQIGREDTPERYIENLVAVFREVWRVLRPDGTLWIIISDTYCGTGSKGNHFDPKYPKGRTGQQVSINHRAQGCKQKDLIGIPWLLAFALRSDGWYLRNAAIWEKGNAMPENVKDRLTRSYEFVFLLAKSKSYYYDGAAIAEPIAAVSVTRMKGGRSDRNKYTGGIPGQTKQGINRPRAAGAIPDELIPAFRNKRDVFHINTVPYGGAHFAAFPPKLAETCILAGCPTGGIVLDPFIGSGTTGLVAVQTGRRYIGIDLNAEYCRLAKERIDSLERGDTA
jgi:DNA modification methylase